MRTGGHVIFKGVVSKKVPKNNPTRRWLSEVNKEPQWRSWENGGRNGEQASRCVTDREQWSLHYRGRKKRKKAGLFSLVTRGLSVTQGEQA